MLRHFDLSQSSQGLGYCAAEILIGLKSDVADNRSFGEAVGIRPKNSHTFRLPGASSPDERSANNLLSSGVSRRVCLFDPSRLP